MLFDVQELIDMVIMTLAVGYIFMDMFSQGRAGVAGFDKKAFWFSCMVTAPALIVHELAHKFVGLAFGLTATFHAAYVWLIIAIVLKLARTGFIFLVPAYVSLMGKAGPLETSLTAFAGPLLNGVLFLAAWLMLKQPKLKKSTFMFLEVTKQINLFLFVFNMLPIPGFDGLKVYAGLWKAFM